MWYRPCSDSDGPPFTHASFPSLITGYLTDRPAGYPHILAHNPNLRSVTLHSSVSFSLADATTRRAHLYGPISSCTLSLLSQITSPIVSEIYLPIVASESSALDCLDWPCLDEVLARPLWRHSLKRVVMNIRLARGGLLDPGDLDLVRLRLPMISNMPSVSLTIRSRLLPQDDHSIFHSTVT
jgi:hypothetical protein